MKGNHPIGFRTSWLGAFQWQLSPFNGLEIRLHDSLLLEFQLADF
jgi:hypothetical protein